MKKTIILVVIMISAVSAFCLEKYVDIDMIRYASAPRTLDEGFLFTLPPDTGYTIFLRHNGDNWQMDYHFRQNMYKVWCLYLPYSDIKVSSQSSGLLYKLNINGFWDNDPNNANFIYDRFHEKISYLRIPADKDNSRKRMPIISESEDRFKKQVTFKYYNPDAKEVSVVCSDTNWAVFSHNMQPDKFGYWSISLNFGKGHYCYYFIADWEKVLDDWNPDSEYEQDIGLVNTFRIE